MNKIKTVLVEVKNHVKRNEVAYVMGLVAVSAITLQQRNLKAFYKFLNEKGIDPMEYYAPEYFEELTQAKVPA